MSHIRNGIILTEINEYDTNNTYLGNICLKFRNNEIFIYSIDNDGNQTPISLPHGHDGYLLRHNGVEWLHDNSITITSNEVIINEEGLNNLNFRVETDTNSHMFFVDSLNNTIGINNNSPDSNTSIDIGGNKPLRLNRMTTTNINNLTLKTGMIMYNSTIDKIQYVGGSIPEVKMLDNLYGHKGSGYKYINNNYTININDFFIVADASSSNITLTLPTTGLYNGLMFHIKCWKSSSYFIKINTSTSAIENLGSLISITGNESWIIIYNTELNKWLRIN